MQSNNISMHNKRRLEAIYQHKDHELVISRSPWNSKVEALQRCSIQDWSGPFPIRHGAAIFFASSLLIVFHKNGLYHHLYAFETSTRITLEIFSQMISSHKYQIICSIHEQFDFRTSITCFSFYLPFLSIFLSLFLIFFTSDFFYLFLI